MFSLNRSSFFFYFLYLIYSRIGDAGRKIQMLETDISKAETRAATAETKAAQNETQADEAMRNASKVYIGFTNFSNSP